jgi:plasmid stability protein
MSETVMAQVLVRELEEVVKPGLKRRAARHGKSMEEGIRAILRNAVRQEQAPASRLGSRIAARFRGQGLDTDLPGLQDREALAASQASKAARSPLACRSRKLGLALEREHFFGNRGDEKLVHRHLSFLRHLTGIGEQ